MQPLTQANERERFSPPPRLSKGHLLSLSPPTPPLSPWTTELAYSHLLPQYACKDAAFVISEFLIIRRFISCSGYRMPSNDIIITNYKLRRIWMKAIVAYNRYHFRIFTDKMEKPRDSVSGRDWNLGLLDYEAGILTTSPRGSVGISGESSTTNYNCVNTETVSQLDLLLSQPVR
jgi:hypothetical protein